MRTTVEITEDQHRALTALAQRRGLRGFSALVQEALGEYLSDREADELDLLLQLEGIISESEAQEMRERIAQIRSTWRAP